MELGLERCLQARHVPLLLDGFFGHELPENVRDDAGAQPRHQGGNVLCIKNLVALRVDFLALVVGDIVVLEELLADVEVPRLDLPLRALDRAGHHGMLDRLALGHLQHHHDPVDAVAGEDPGSSRFYMALEDPLLRIFAGDRINRIMVMLKMPEGEAIEHAMVSRSIESAQRKVEARNFDIRKQLLEYDDVANDQRKEIYAQRNEILDAKDVSALVTRLRAGVITDIFRQFVPEESVEEQWDMAGLETALKAELHLELPLRGWLEAEPELDDEGLLERITEKAHEAYQAKVPVGAEESFRQYERYVTLQVIDSHWREHLAALDHLRQGIHLRGYAQKNPKQEYKREAFELFGQMLDMIRDDVVKIVMTVRIQSREEIEAAEEELSQSHVENVHYQHADFDANAAPEELLAPTANPAAAAQSHAFKAGRNDPCP